MLITPDTLCMVNLAAFHSAATISGFFSKQRVFSTKTQPFLNQQLRNRHFSNPKNGDKFFPVFDWVFARKKPKISFAVFHTHVCFVFSLNWFEIQSSKYTHKKYYSLAPHSCSEFRKRPIGCKKRSKIKTSTKIEEKINFFSKKKFSVHNSISPSPLQ